MTFPLFATVVGGLVAARHLSLRRRDPARFLATVSHELRTPLNAIMGWVNLMKSGTLAAADAAHALDCIQRNVQLETRLVDELLGASHMLSGKALVVLAPVEMRSLVEKAIEGVAPTAQAKGVRLVRTMAHTPSLISGDERRLGDAFSHLLLNAVKFTPPGGEVRVDFESCGNRICLRVADNGEGIAPDDLRHVFEAFVQGRTRARRSGLGLGLAVVRQLIQLHGGTISAHSAGRGHGAVFRVTMPILSNRSDSRETKGQ